jgi:hypothetical protein
VKPDHYWRRQAIALILRQKFDPFGREQPLIDEVAKLLAMPPEKRPTTAAGMTLRQAKAAFLVKFDRVDALLAAQIAELERLIELEEARPHALTLRSVGIDSREQIRESRAYEATTGPPRGGSNEIAPEFAQNSTGPISGRRADTNRTATLPASPENFQRAILRAEKPRPKTERANGDADLNHEDVADDISKTRH